MPVTLADGGTIVRIAARGDGVTVDGRHVAMAAPGDVVGSDGTLIPGPNRAVPVCRHFGSCGGCQLQHLRDGAYAGYLHDRIAGALAGQGLAAEEIAVPHVSPQCSRRRASLKAQRVRGAVVLGFHRHGSRDIVDMAECHVLAPELFALVTPMRKLLAGVNNWRSVEVEMTLADQGVDLLLRGIGATTLAGIERLTGFARTHRLARLATDDGSGAQVQWEPEPVTVTLGTRGGQGGRGVPVPLPQGAFLQATADGEAALVAAVLAGVGEAAMVADLFAGLGTFALALVQAGVPGRRVYAAEAARDAAAALKSAADRQRLPVFVEHRDLYRRPLMAAEINRFDAVVIDPPRAGAEEQCREIAASTLKKLVYVSCNPASFARDAKGLAAAGFAVRRASPVGQFGWSTHVELCAVLERG